MIQRSVRELFVILFGEMLESDYHFGSIQLVGSLLDHREKQITVFELGLDCGPVVLRRLTWLRQGLAQLVEFAKQ